MKQARRMQKMLKVNLRPVYRDVQRKLAASPAQQATFQDLLGRMERLLTQQRQDKNKLYSVHAPEVECLAKAHKLYEFGLKVSVHGNGGSSSWSSKGKDILFTSIIA